MTASSTGSPIAYAQRWLGSPRSRTRCPLQWDEPWDERRQHGENACHPLRRGHRGDRRPRRRARSEQVPRGGRAGEAGAPRAGGGDPCRFWAAEGRALPALARCDAGAGVGAEVSAREADR